MKKIRYFLFFIFVFLSFTAVSFIYASDTGVSLNKLNQALTGTAEKTIYKEPPKSHGSGFLGQLLIIIFGVIIFGGGYFLIVNKKTKKEESLGFFKVIDKISLKKTDLYLVEFEGLLLVIGAADNSVSLIREITEPNLKKKFLDTNLEKQSFSSYLNFFKKDI